MRSYSRLRPRAATLFGPALTAAVTCPIAIGLLVQFAAAAAPMNEIEGAWQRKQSAVTSARFVWKTTRTDTKGAYTSAVRRVDPDTEAFPPQDTTYSLREEIVFDARRGRHTTKGQAWDFSGKRLVPRDDVRVLGADSVATLSDSIEGIRGKQGAIYQRDHPFLGITARPVIYCLRAFAPNFGGVQSGSLSFEGNVEINGIDVVLLHDQQGLKFYVDPSRDYVVLRHSGIRPGGEPRFQLDIDYDREESIGWIPSGWRLIEYGDEGNARIVMSCEVVDYSLNEPLSEDLFEIIFPEGTRVFDQRTRRDYVVGSSAESGFGGGRRLWIVYIVVGLLLVAIIVVARRRRQRGA